MTAIFFYWLRDYGSHDNYNNNVMILAAATIYLVFTVLAMLSFFSSSITLFNMFGDIIPFLYMREQRLDKLTYSGS